MKPLLAILAATALLAMGAAQENVYRNMTTPSNPLTGFGTNNEFGDQILLAGSSRTIKSFSFAYNGDIPGQGDETITLRFYDNTGPSGSPGALLWQSPAIAAKPGIWLKTVVVPNITGPNTVIWTIQSGGVSGTAGDRIELLAWNPPTIGSSGDFFWQKVSGVWGTYQIGGGSPIANFQCSMWAVEEPVYPFDNTLADTGYYSPFLQEYGDQVDFEGSKRILKKLTFAFYCPSLFDDPEVEDLIVRIYRLDGAGSNPSTLVYESPPIPFSANPQSDQVVALNLPDILADDRMAWTVQFRNVTQEHPVDAAGLLIFDSPVSGSSRDFFYARNVPGYPEWSQWAFGASPLANFYSRFEAVGETTITPGSYAVDAGIEVGGTLQSFFYQDDDRHETQGAPVAALGDPSIIVRVNATCPTETPASIRIRVVINTSGLPASAVPQRIELRNFQTNTWEIVDSRFASGSDAVIELTPKGNPSRFVQPGTRLMQMRMVMLDPGLLFMPGWRMRVNQAVWIVQSS